MPASEVFEKYAAGKLRSGSKRGPKVKNRKQAVAIYLSEKRNEDETGSPDRAQRLKIKRTPR